MQDGAFYHETWQRRLKASPGSIIFSSPPAVTVLYVIKEKVLVEYQPKSGDPTIQIRHMVPGPVRVLSIHTPRNMTSHGSY